MTKEEIRKELAKYIIEQSNMIDEAKKQNKDSCELVEIPKEYIKREFEYYYTVMIGYQIKDNMIYFKKRKPVINENDDLFPEYVIRQDGQKDRTLFY